MRRRKPDHARARAWKQWIAEHRPRLERIGLPLAVYQDEAHWLDFLDNGHLHVHDDGPPFDVSELSNGQLRQLCAFLQVHCTTEAARLLTVLRTRLGEEPEVGPFE